MSSQCVILQQDFSTAAGESQRRHNAPAGLTAALEDLVHDLRQPLGSIDSIVYFMELTVREPQIFTQLQKIRGLVAQASNILEQASSLA